MNVAALQKHLLDLAEFISAAGAGVAAVKSLKAVVDGLSPFAAQRVEAFAEFLAKAEEYHKTGVLTPAKGKKSTGPARPAAGAPTLDDVKGKVATLYARAAAATDAQIDELLTPLEKPFSLTDLKAVADAIGVGGKVAKVRAKGEVVREIRRAILDRRGMAQRSEQ